MLGLLLLTSRRRLAGALRRLAGWLAPQAPPELEGRPGGAQGPLAVDWADSAEALAMVVARVPPAEPAAVEPPPLEGSIEARRMVPRRPTQRRV